MIWESSDHSNWRVVENTGWRNIDNYGSFQARAGVYIFANVDLQVKYIGKAGAGRIVDEIASAIRRAKDWGATKVKVLYTNSSDNAASLERLLIDKYNPPNNLT
ncbi:unnamed protein product [marine sediment metagenome]|uniref:GIY-YIG domain-containing protein n=1 Tax=marine sediment metagenome TaxID=412755 RepID=X1MXQ9_9ZZZZ